MPNSLPISPGSRFSWIVLFPLVILLLGLPTATFASPSLFRATSFTVTKDAPAQTMVLSQGAITDPDYPPAQLIVTASSSAGIVFTNLRVDPVTQKIMGEVQATCAATAGLQNYLLLVSNPTSGANSSIGRITVRLGQASYPSAAPISQNGARVILANTLTTGVNTLNVSSPTFTGDLSINQTTGAISINRARPVGTHTINVSANVSCTTVNFPITLTVVPGNEEYQGAVGDPLSAGSTTIGQPGSVLSFLYTSNVNEDTLIRINNLHLSLTTTLHMLFVGAGGYSDQFMCLAPQSSVTLRASDMDPGQKGRLLVVAVNAAGAPTSFNYLSGTEDISLASGHAAKNLKAISYQALFPEGSSLTADEVGNATINLDGVSYSKAARTLKLEDVPSPTAGNDTLLFVLPTSFSATGNDVIPGINGMLYEKKIPGTYYPFAWGGIDIFASLSDSFPTTTPAFSQLLTGGRNWQMIFYPTNEMTGITGLWLNLDAAKPSANKADWLRPQALTSASKIVIPVFPAACF